MQSLGIVLLVVITYFNQPSNGKTTTEMQYFCSDHTPQKTIDLDLLMGRWYIVEIIHHLMDDGMMGGYITLDTCPSVFLQQETATNLRLVWTEPGYTVNYIMKKSSAGLWVSSGPHNDSLVEHGYFYNAYSGTIEVMKAVSSHAVLTFCKSERQNSQLFSVVLSREAWLPRQELRGVNSMLQRRKLHLVLVKQTCLGSTGSNIQHNVILFLLSFLLIVLSRCFTI